MLTSRAARPIATEAPRSLPHPRRPPIDESPDAPGFIVLPGLDPMRAKIASRIERHRSFIVMVRPDRSIGVPKIALTGVIVPMVRSSRTMTGMEGARLLSVLF